MKPHFLQEKEWGFCFACSFDRRKEKDLAEWNIMRDFKVVFELASPIFWRERIER
jgi:hypothetical protein